MDRPEPLGSRGERLLHLAAVADVAGRDVRGPVEHRGRRLEPVAVAREQRQRRPVAVEPPGDRTPDPGARTGDDDVTSGIRSHGFSRRSQFAGKS